MPSQISTLLQKNFNQLKNRKCNTICYIISPLSILFLLFFGRQLAQIIVIQSLPVLKTDVPLLYNIPLYSKLKYSNISSKTTNCEEWYLYDFAEEANNTESKELFQELIGPKNMMTTFCDDNPPQYNSSPYFLTPNEAKIYDNETNINSYLYNRGIDLNHIPVKTLKNESSLTIAPDGAMTIKNLNRTYFNYNIQVRDYKVSYYHRGSGVTLFYILNENTKEYVIFPSAITGSLWEIGIMNKAYMHELFPNITVISGVQILPINPEENETNVQKIVTIVTFGLYPFFLSLLVPFFVYNIVYEKEKKIIQLLKISGVKMRYYWISNFLLNYIIYLIMSILFILFEVFISNLKNFQRTSPLLIILFFLGWGFGQIGLSYFIQAFISKERLATVISLSIICLIYFVNFCLNMALYVRPREAPYILNIFPSFALYRIFHYITFSCGYFGCLSSFDKVNTELKYSLFFMYLGGILFILLGIFLTDIFQKLDKKSKLFYFDITDIKNKEIKKEKRIIENIDEDEDKNNNIIDNQETKLIKKEQIEYELNNLSIDYPLNDEELKKETEKIGSIMSLPGDDLKQIPFICQRISDENKKILDNFSLCLSQDEIFGLVDVQGEGKASFYSILNKIFNNRRENDIIYIDGNNINFNMERIHELIAFMPKIDILWDDLTVQDTLLFFSKIKNKKKGKKKIFQMVKTILSKIKLDRHKKKLVGNLKERTKRRLSLGIALIGEPAVLFLDEPTNGLDPKNKRIIWNILFNFKKSTSIIINSYFMDEYQNLCNRIGIISKGKLKYLGNQFKFINEYTKKYKLEISIQKYDKYPNIINNDKNKLDEIIEEENENEINTINKKVEKLCAKEKLEKIKKYILKIFPKGCSVFEEFNYNISFKIGYDVLNIKLLFKKLKEDKEKLHIENWGISQFNLEDIIIKLIE